MTRQEYDDRRRQLCARGSMLPQSKLSESDVKQIKKNKNGLNGRQMSECFSVSPTCIYEIWSGDTWAHV